MELHARYPAPPLRRFVELLWSHEGPPQAHARERCLPTGTLELVVNLREDVIRAWDPADPTRCRTLPGAVICGAHSSYFVIDTDEKASVVGAHFRPGGAFPFLGLPADEARDLQVPLEALWGLAAAAELRERVLAAPTAEARLAELEACLLARASAPGRHAAVPFAVAALRRGAAVAGVAERAGLSHRRLTQVFRREVGLTPKAYQRVMRFQSVLDRLEADPSPDWVEVSLACGFYDQAHLGNEVKAITGLTPVELAAARGPHRNHVPLALKPVPA